MFLVIRRCAFSGTGACTNGLSFPGTVQRCGYSPAGVGEQRGRDVKARGLRLVQGEKMLTFAARKGHDFMSYTRFVDKDCPIGEEELALPMSDDLKKAIFSLRETNNAR